MTLNYWVTMERYPSPYGVVGGSIHAIKSSLYSTKKKRKKKKKKKKLTRYVGR